MLKRLVLVTLAALNLAAVSACGRLPVTQTGFAAPRTAVVTSIMAGGKQRKLGFDLGRAKLQAPNAHPQKLAPVQGLMPTRVDLRANCSPVADQADLGSCT